MASTRSPHGRTLAAIAPAIIDDSIREDLGRGRHGVAFERADAEYQGIGRKLPHRDRDERSSSNLLLHGKARQQCALPSHAGYPFHKSKRVGDAKSLRLQRMTSERSIELLAQAE